jgi:hypothetical protein
MRVAEKLDWKGLKFKKSVGNRKMMISDEVRHRIGKGKRPQLLRRLALCIVTTSTELTRLPIPISESRHSKYFCDYLPANPGVGLTFVFNHHFNYPVVVSLLEKHRVLILFSECRLKLMKYIDGNTLE